MKKKIQKFEEKGRRKIIWRIHLFKICVIYVLWPRKIKKEYTRFLDIFKRLQINVPFYEALEKMPTYAMFIEENLTKKIRYTNEKIIRLEASYNTII